MSLKQWELTEYRTIELKQYFGEVGTWHMWLQERQSYCDRGHWNWGYTGLSAHHDVVEPSLYYLSWEAALTELEEFAVRTLTGSPSAITSRKLPNFSENEWVVDKSDKSFNKMLNGKNGGIFVKVSPHTGPTGPIWISEISGIDELDASDGFPRIYLHKEIALAETERFLKWRLNKEPFEYPYDVTSFIEEVSQNGQPPECLNISEQLLLLIKDPKEISKPKRKIAL